MTIRIYTSSQDLTDAAADLALRLGQPLTDAHTLALQLELLADDCAPGYRLCLSLTCADAPGPITCDFTTGRNAHRRRYGGGRGQSIARAIGIRKNPLPTVIDTTAGLGRDAYVLATLGCEVTMLERSPVLAAMLENGLQRAIDQDPDDPVFQRLRLVNTEASDYLQQLKSSLYADVIYLDPMYPHRDKHALVKKEMQILQQLLGSNDDAPRILASALPVARQRVVVKRPVWAASLEGPAPRHEITGKTTRFDIYPSR
ncbi:MAG TPA: rRNA methyltransferase [Gammaproteobacteria bacterium]|nr:rRNA methyltransferase [Gammaproteobacteria bacterium]